MSQQQAYALNAQVQGLLHQCREYRHDQLVRQDVVSLCLSCQSLSPRLGSLQTAPSRFANVISLVGTVPIDYKGAKYNIPVSIHIPHTYPYAPPVPVVTPTPQMVVKEGHRCVQSNGVVVLPYLQQWRGGASSLFELLTLMASAFSHEPPVYARLNQAASTSSLQPVQSQMLQHPTLQQARSTPTLSASTTPQKSEEDSTAVLAKAVDAKARVWLAQFEAQMGIEMKKLWEMESTLQTRSNSFSELEKQLVSEISALQSRLGNLEKEEKELQAAVVQLQSRETPDPDTLFLPSDPLAVQYMECLAEDAACDDVLYYASKAVDRGSITLDQFLKLVRESATRMFFARALGKKIRAWMNAPRPI